MAKKKVIDNSILMSASFIDSTILKNSFDLMDKYCVDMLHMNFIDDGIEIKTLDVSKTCGYYCTIGLDYMNNLSGIGTVFFNENDYLKGVKQKLKGKSEIEVRDTHITFLLGKNKHVLRLCDPIPLLEHIPKFDCCYVEIKTDDFMTALDSIKNYEIDFLFSLTKDEFVMKCGTDKFSYGEFSIKNKDLLTIQMLDGVEKVESRFNPDLVSDHLNIFRMSKSVEIGIGNDTPIIFKPKIYGARVTIFIAPRIDRDENERRKKESGIGT